MEEAGKAEQVSGSVEAKKGRHLVEGSALSCSPAKHMS